MCMNTDVLFAVFVVQGCPVAIKEQLCRFINIYREILMKIHEELSSGDKNMFWYFERIWEDGLSPGSHRPMWTRFYFDS